jgi:hypothetical protein
VRRVQTPVVGRSRDRPHRPGPCREANVVITQGRDVRPSADAPVFPVVARPIRHATGTSGERSVPGQRGNSSRTTSASQADGSGSALRTGQGAGACRHRRATRYRRGRAVRPDHVRETRGTMSGCRTRSWSCSSSTSTGT